MQFDSFLSLMFVEVLGFFTLLYIASGIKVVKDWERLAVFRLGKYYGIKGPGIIRVTPILEKIALKLSLRDQMTDVDTGNFISNDGSSTRWKGHVTWRVIDVEKAALAIENYYSSVERLIVHNVQEVAESLPSDTILIDKELVYSMIRQVLEPDFSKWGVKLTEINLKDASKWE